MGWGIQIVSENSFAKVSTMGGELGLFLEWRR